MDFANTNIMHFSGDYMANLQDCLKHVESFPESDEYRDGIHAYLEDAEEMVYLLVNTYSRIYFSLLTEWLVNMNSRSVAAASVMMEMAIYLKNTVNHNPSIREELEEEILNVYHTWISSAFYNNPYPWFPLEKLLDWEWMYSNVTGTAAMEEDYYEKICS